MDVLTSFWIGITSFGNSYSYAVLLLASYFLIERRFAVKQILIIASAYLAVYSLKDFFKIERPPKELWKVNASGYSFPSGHATAASAFWSSIAMYFKKNVVYIFSSLAIFLISASRIFLGVHRIEDVAFGVFLGFAIAFFFSIAEKKMKKSVKEFKAYYRVFLLLIALPFAFFNVHELSFIAGFLLAHALLANYFPEPREKKRKLFSFIVALSIFALSFVICYYALLGFLAFVVPLFIARKAY